jgi:hypothetical protein
MPFHGLFAALLLDLQVYLDVVNIDIDPNVELFQHLSLQVLDACSSHMENPEAVACIIFSMLPRVRKVTRHWSTNTFGWDEVNSRLESLRFSVVEYQEKFEWL